MAREIPTNYIEARGLADKARARAYARVDHQVHLESVHRIHVESLLRQHWWQFWKPISLPMTSLPFDMAVDRRLATDVQYKVAISDNQWYVQYATMYAQGEQLRELRELNRRFALYLRSPVSASRADYTEAA